MMSPYLRRLRALVGHELLVLPSVTILAFDEEGRMLLARHRDTGRWVAPGGMIEPDEIPEETARREMREETGCDVALGEILGVFGGPRFRVRYDNGDEASYVMTVYRAQITGGAPRADGDEMDEVRFVAREELPRLDTAEWLNEVLRAVLPG